MKTHFIFKKATFMLWRGCVIFKLSNLDFVLIYNFLQSLLTFLWTTFVLVLFNTFFGGGGDKVYSLYLQEIEKLFRRKNIFFL